MKNLLWSLLCLLCADAALAQDLIVRKDGEVLEVKVVEVAPLTVRFKKWNNPDGPLYTVDKDKLSAIRYRDGTWEKTLQKTEIPPVSVETNSGIDAQAGIPSRSAPVKREKRWQFGITARQQFVFTTLKADDMDSQSGVSYLPAFGLSADYYLLPYLAQKTHLSFALEYSLTKTRFNYSDKSWTTFACDYFAVSCGIGQHNSFGYWKAGPRLLLLVRSRLDGGDQNGDWGRISGSEYANKIRFGLFLDGGFCLGKHVDLGGQLEWCPTNLMKPEIWKSGPHGEKTRSASVTFSVTFAYRF